MATIFFRHFSKVDADRWLAPRAAGTPADALTEELLSSVYGVDVRLETLLGGYRVCAPCPVGLSRPSIGSAAHRLTATSVCQRLH